MLSWQRVRTVLRCLLSHSSGFRLVGVLVIAGFILLLGAAGYVVEAGPQEKQECTRVLLGERQRPWMTASGAWNGSDLLLADSVRKSLLRYSDTGRALGKVLGPAVDELRSFSPERVIGGGQNKEFVLELKDDQFVTLDSAYRLVRRWNGSALQDVRTTAIRKSDSAQVIRIFNSAMAGSDLIAFADLRHPGGAGSSALVRIPMVQPASFSTLADVSEGTLEFSLLGYPYVTSLGNTAYVLLMEPEMRIVRNVAGGGAELKELAQATEQLFRGRKSPALPAFGQGEDFATVMRVVEESEMPMGIYGWEGFLYVLSRKPDHGGTTWSLSKIDPKNDKLVATTTLPTRANHLTVIPGPDKWAFVEKGPVEGFTTQSVESLHFVPSSRIRGVSKGFSGKVCP